MTHDEAIATIRRAFAALSPQQKKNLRWHARNGTSIACGKHAVDYVSLDGYG